MDSIIVNGKEFKVGDTVVVSATTGFYKDYPLEQKIVEIVSPTSFKAKFPNLIHPDTYTFGRKYWKDQWGKIVRFNYEGCHLGI